MKQQKQNKRKSASFDYPLYEKMVKKAPRAAGFWLAGDRLYHLGLFVIMASIPLLFVVYTQWGSGTYLFWCIGFLIVAVCLAALGIYLKRESYKLAMKAGIDLNNL